MQYFLVTAFLSGPFLVVSLDFLCYCAFGFLYFLYYNNHPITTSLTADEFLQTVSSERTGVGIISFTALCLVSCTVSAREDEQ